MSADTKSLMDMAYEERSDLAAFLKTLTPQEWNAASLCDKWTVKDVVAHVVSYEELNFFGLVKRFAKGWVVRANEVGVKEFAAMSPDDLASSVNRWPSLPANAFANRELRAGLASGSECPKHPPVEERQDLLLRPAAGESLA